MESEILIFRTSISKRQDIKRIGKVLNGCNGVEKWSVDFEDWEKILRVECNKLSAADIPLMLREINIFAVELE